MLFEAVEWVILKTVNLDIAHIFQQSATMSVSKHWTNQINLGAGKAYLHVEKHVNVYMSNGSMCYVVFEHKNSVMDAPIKVRTDLPLFGEFLWMKVNNNSCHSEFSHEDEIFINCASFILYTTLHY